MVVTFFQAVIVAATVGPVAIRAEGAWHVINRETLTVEARYARLGSHDATQASDATVDPTGRSLVYVAWSEAAQNLLLYLWRVGDAASKEISEHRGFHAAPTFSNDGRRVFFAHHPRKGGPPGQHDEGANAQVYRYELRTGRLDAQTREPGCHMQPHVGSGGQVAYAHTDCHAGRGVRVLRHRNVEVSLTGHESHHGWVMLSRDENTVYFVEEENGLQSVMSLQVTQPSSRRLRCRLSLSESLGRSHLVRNETAVLFEVEAGALVLDISSCKTTSLSFSPTRDAGLPTP